ncbi:MAG: DivIVA domain-containing protein [Kineosporiaceae bacterium]
MTLVFTVLTIVVLGLVVAVALGRIGGGLDAATSSLPPTGLPDGDLVAGDLDHVRFAPALRGYRMDQVDAAFDRLAEELARRDAEIERLSQAQHDASPAPALVDVYVEQPYLDEPYADDAYANHPPMHRPSTEG